MIKRILNKLGYIKTNELRSLLSRDEIVHVDTLFRRFPMLISNSKNSKFGLKDAELKDVSIGASALSKLFYESN